LYILSRFGMLYQEKSGNPGSESLRRTPWNPFDRWFWSNIWCLRPTDWKPTFNKPSLWNALCQRSLIQIKKLQS
jgi:hypothetical protein